MTACFPVLFASGVANAIEALESRPAVSERKTVGREPPHWWTFAKWLCSPRAAIKTIHR